MLFSSRPPLAPAPRVAITGAGIVTALGLDWATNQAAFRTGQTAFRQVTLFDVSRQRVQTAAQVDLPSAPPRPALLPKRHWTRLDRAARLLLWASLEAWDQSGWAPGINLPVVLGTTSGGMSLGQDYLLESVQAPRQYRRQAARIAHYQCQRQGLDVANALGLTGQILIIANACASGANAIGHAFELLRRGEAERVLTGGYDALSHLVFAGFDSLQALSPTRCRPFDAARDGLALGEGAAVFALEPLTVAEARGARVLGEIVGYSATTDLHHLAQPDPQGAAARQAMKSACRNARLHPSQISYVNAHGTGTVLNDSAETAALNDWAEEHAPNLAVSSTKASIGHLLGAAGAVEAAVCLMALQGQWLPPTATLERPDPAARFRLVREPAHAHFEYALTNSFGFGGSNASLILRRWS